MNGATHHSQTHSPVKESAGTEGMARGSIYVLRQVDGTLMPLRIKDQHTYKEWTGCFSAL